MGLTIRLLGPLEVTLAGRPVALTAGRLRTLLAVLALSAGRTVSVSRLTTALWGEDPPDNARRSVQTYVTRLRRLLGAESIRTSSAGYTLCVTPDHVDVLRFASLLDDAAAAKDPSAERALLVEALELCRGAPFDGLRSTWLEETQAPFLVERYLSAVERRIDIDIADGRHSELVPHLGELTAQHPLRESLWVRLLVVLHRCGRQAEALERYEAVRVRIADELGADPGPELRQVHADLLISRTPQLADQARAAAVADRVVAQQLPADIEGFIGRDAALQALDDLVDVPGRTPAPGRVVIATIAGTAGVGKTTLAVHWAHTVADRFPDGQLYVNLRGFHPSGAAMSPADAVRGFLDALQAPQQQVPASMEAQVGLYRSLLVGKRVLVVLDNARDADQVRPLLPGSSGCLVLVTSRNPLRGLVATEGAHAINIDLLSVEESRQLLARRLGRRRVDRDRASADEIISRCARLPLALAIVAARAATRPTFPLDALATELRDTQGRLTALDGGDAASDVRSVLSWSYRMLRPDAAELFRFLGLHPGPDVATSAAAALVGGSTQQVRPLLAELTRAHLITEHTPGRYTFHDLLRAYAAELARTHDPDAERRAAVHRMLDHYLHTARGAALLVDTYREPITLPPGDGVTLDVLDDRDHALAWFATEHRVLLAIVELAWRHGFDRHTWQLAWTLADFLQWRGHWHDRAATQHFALQATQRLGDHAEQARAHRGLGHAYTRLDRYDDAHDHIRQALRLYGQLDDPGGEARAHLGLSYVFERQGDHAGALEHAQRALALYPPIGHEISRARTLNAVGWCHAQLGDHRTAIEHCEQALRLQQAFDDRVAQGATWDSLGYAHHRLGNHRQAADCYRHAIDQRRELGHRYGEANTLTRLGDTYQATGDIDAARRVWLQALAILDPLGEADHVRIRLGRVVPAVPSGTGSW